jgi:hypothetical protein
MSSYKQSSQQQRRPLIRRVPISSPRTSPRSQAQRPRQVQRVAAPASPPRTPPPPAVEEDDEENQDYEQPEEEEDLV